MGRQLFHGHWRALLAGALLALTACGGGGDGGSEEAAAAKAAPTVFAANGIWWNPAQPGSGFFFEAQGNRGVVTFYAYETDGRPVWYSAAGSMTQALDGKFQFSGMLLRYSGGQSANATVAKVPTSTQEVPATINFDGESARVQVGTRSFDARKFHRTGQYAPASGQQPETGIYWNPAESGRGYAIEVADGAATVAVFHYTADGQPTWHLAVVPLQGSGAGKAQFQSYSGGQTLTGAHKVPVAAAQGQFTLQFGESCAGKLAFPSMALIPVQRFPFGSLPAGLECRTPRLDGAVEYFEAVSLKLDSPTKAEGRTPVGSSVLNQFIFSVSGDVAALANKTVYALVENPQAGDLYFENPRVTVDNTVAPPRIKVGVTTQGLNIPGRFKGQVRIFACLDVRCTVQFRGSPFVVPYDFEVTTGPSIANQSFTGEFKPQDAVLRHVVTLTVPPNTSLVYVISLTGSAYASWRSLNHPMVDGRIEVKPSEGMQTVPIEFSVLRSGSNLGHYRDYRFKVMGTSNGQGPGMGFAYFDYGVLMSVTRAP